MKRRAPVGDAGSGSGVPKRGLAETMMPGFDARRIYLRDAAGPRDQQSVEGTPGSVKATESDALDFSKCSAASQPGTAELVALAAKVASGTLVSLNLANVGIGGEAALALADALGTDSCALLALNVRGNWSTMDDDEVDSREGLALAQALRPAGHESSLTELDAGGNNLWGSAVGVAFAAAVRTPGTCSVLALDLQGCAIGDAGAMAIASTLREGSSLISLGIGWNQLSTESSTAVVVALQSPACKLERLGHWRNDLREMGGRAIATSLTSAHCCLTELDIGWNEIGPAAGLAIAKALASRHCKLTKLVAGNNSFGPAAGLAFAEVVGSTASRLEHLAIHMNGFGEAAGAAFADRMPLVLASDDTGAAGGASRCVLKELFLNSNSFGGDALGRFVEQFQAAIVARKRNEQQQGKTAMKETAPAGGTRPRGLALLNLQDNGISQPDAESMARVAGAQCVETLLL
jgi:hypothetical protein